MALVFLELGVRPIFLFIFCTIFFISDHCLCGCKGGSSHRTVYFVSKRFGRDFQKNLLFMTRQITSASTSSSLKRNREIIIFPLKSTVVVAVVLLLLLLLYFKYYDQAIFRFFSPLLLNVELNSYSIAIWSYPFKDYFCMLFTITGGLIFFYEFVNYFLICFFGRFQVKNIF